MLGPERRLTVGRGRGRRQTVVAVTAAWAGSPRFSQLDRKTSASAKGSLTDTSAAPDKGGGRVLASCKSPELVKGPDQTLTDLLAGSCSSQPSRGRSDTICTCRPFPRRMSSFLLIGVVPDAASLICRRRDDEVMRALTWPRSPCWCRWVGGVPWQVAGSTQFEYKCPMVSCAVEADAGEIKRVMAPHSVCLKGMWRGMGHRSVVQN